MAKQPKTRTFIVARTPKLKDSLGNYCFRGETCQLTKEQAEFFQKLGFIQVTLDDMYNDDSARSTSEPADPPSGNDDEAETSEDASDDTGTSTDEGGAKRPLNRRRKRVAS